LKKIGSSIDSVRENTPDEPFNESNIRTAVVVLQRRYRAFVHYKVPDLGIFRKKFEILPGFSVGLASNTECFYRETEDPDGTLLDITPWFHCCECGYRDRDSPCKQFWRCVDCILRLGFCDTEFCQDCYDALPKEEKELGLHNVVNVGLVLEPDEAGSFGSRLPDRLSFLFHSCRSFLFEYVCLAYLEAVESSVYYILNCNP